MTPNPNVPLRLEMTFELPGTPEQLWDAIATAQGISAWFMPTDLDERVGGTIVTHMGEDSSPGTVTGWDPPLRFAVEEPEWAALAGHAGESVTPLATEFLIEARSGGTCVLRVVTSAFGTGADWEQEFFEEMEKGWRPFFDRLRLYLAHFPGQRATPLDLIHTVKGRAGPVFAAMRQSLGLAEVGQSVDARGLTGDRPEDRRRGRAAAASPIRFPGSWPSRPGTAARTRRRPWSRRSCSPRTRRRWSSASGGAGRSGSRRWRSRPPESVGAMSFVGMSRLS